MNFIESYKKNTNLKFISGHRGSIDFNFPENSTISILETLKSTPAFFEIDPRYSIDKKIFLMHDEDLSRTTNKIGEIGKTHSTALNNIYLKKSNGDLSTEVVPSLEAILNHARGRFIVNLDIKSVTVEDLYLFIKKTNSFSNVMFTVHTKEQAKFLQGMRNNIYLSIHINNMQKYNDFKNENIDFNKSIVYIGSKITNQNKDLIDFFKKKGIMTMVSTSTSLDKEKFKKSNYSELYNKNISIIETDFPIELSKNN